MGKAMKAKGKGNPFSTKGGKAASPQCMGKKK